MIDLKLVSFVMRAKNRQKVLYLLENEAKIPAQIMKETGMYKGHTSRALKELSERNLIFCKNPEDRSYKFYAIARKGKDILKKIKEIRKTI